MTGPLRDLIGSYNPLEDPQSCDLTRGDAQCPMITRHGDDGFLHCTYKIGHTGPHHTAYIGPRDERLNWYRNPEVDRRG